MPFSTTCAPDAGAGAAARATALVADDLAAFEAVLAEALAPQAEYLTEVERGLYAGGKRLRPLLLVLAHRVAQPCRRRCEPLGAKVVHAAVAMEMLHAATLIHDDIADGAAWRRGRPSVHAARGVGVAIVVGDLQFVQALRHFAAAVDTARDMALVRTVLDAGFRLCTGQLDELRGPVGIEVADLRAYCRRVADRKTATLFELACGTGATLAGRGADGVLLLSRFGRLFGRMLQAMDDLADVLEAENPASAPGSDLAQGRPSLPLVYALEELGPSSAVAAVLRDAGGGAGQDVLDAARREVASSAALLRTYAEARGLALECHRVLGGFDPGPHRDALANITLEIVDRGLDHESTERG